MVISCHGSREGSEEGLAGGNFRQIRYSAWQHDTLLSNLHDILRKGFKYLLYAIMCPSAQRFFSSGNINETLLVLAAIVGREYFCFS